MKIILLFVLVGFILNAPGQDVIYDKAQWFKVPYSSDFAEGGCIRKIGDYAQLDTTYAL